MMPFNYTGSSPWGRPTRHRHWFHELEEPTTSRPCSCGCGSRTAGEARPEPAVQWQVTPPAAGAAMRPVADTTQAPFRWVCRIRVQAQRGHSYGSGILVSPSHVLTAAHVIQFRQEPNSWRTIEVGPGFSPTSTAAVRSNGWALDPRWKVADCMTDGSDLALIRLAQPVSSRVGFWNIVPFAPADIAGKPCLLAGYPSRPDDIDATRMYQSNGRIRGSVAITECTPTTARGHMPPAISPTTFLIAHDCDSEGSMSGGPICVFDQGAPRLVAIHTGTLSDGAIKKAVLLSDRIQNEIQDWMNRALRPL
jgi:V8-like Glu-specific endopeptidase